MARIKIEIPNNKLHQLKIQVRITDINYGNHLGNDSMVSILHEARVDWLTHTGYTELNINPADTSEKIGLIMNELIVNYSNESFYGDDLSILLSVGEITQVGFELYYTIETERKDEKIIVAKAKTGMVCYDYSKRKVAEIPSEFKNKLLRHP